jgi:glycosyltransferase involved in cell wall biosynthesis
MKALICVSMFNEVNTIAHVVRGLRSVTDADILIVDDGSTDGSWGAIEKSGFNLPLVVRHKRNLGCGFALRSGFRYALERQYDLLITIDSDGQHVPEEIPQLLQTLPGADIVSGSRFHPQSLNIGSPPSWRLSANQVLAEMVHRHTGYSITDSASGLRCYRTSALSKLRITEAGYAWPFELWGQMARSGLSVAEIPVTRIYSSDGQPDPPDSQTFEQMILLCESILLREMRGESSSAFLFRVLKNVFKKNFNDLLRNYR